ncbi:MAG TPA: MotA/TolQ/ExbB proton channel family protein [Candidatus Acidoferrum sp.]|nr:MotA/TolQ/ExbB proton channel family protein [Candidatus Acidoferrum sp.]
MNMLGLLEKGLFAVGQLLRFPVMVLLWLCVIAVCFMAGSCCMEYLAHRKDRAGFSVKLWLKQGKVLGMDPGTVDQLPLALRQLVTQIRQLHAQHELHEGGLEFLILETEEKLRHGLNASRLLIKVGPSLGLLGTLIPMGVSLASMAAGNLDAMAGQMVVAFTTTIIGLACGTAAYVVNMIRQSWVNELVREQRFIAEHTLAELTEAP